MIPVLRKIARSSGKKHLQPLLAGMLLVGFCGFILGSGFRVVPVAHATITNGMNAFDLVGKYDDNLSAPGPVFTEALTHKLELNSPKGVAIDSANHRLFLADNGNKRVLVYGLNADNTLSDRIPDNVLGQRVFYTYVTAASQNMMYSPSDVAYDAVNSRLFVAEYYGHRVLVYNVATITNGQNAANVLGQPNFTRITASTTQNGVSAPSGLAYDTTSSRLFVAEYLNNRVTVYNVTTITNGQNAANVLGRPNFTTSTAGSTQATMSSPSGLTYDAMNSRLFVADYNNNRVLVHNVTTITNGQNAANVLGQPTFTANTGTDTQNGMHLPANLAYDPSKSRLFVSDNSSSRVLIHNVATITNGQNAANLLGQQNYGTGAADTTQQRMKQPEGLAYDPTNSRLFVADTGNHRVLLQNVATIANGQNAADLVGQTDDSFAAPGPIYTKGLAGNRPNILGMNSLFGVAIDEAAHRLFVADLGNDRILVYGLNADNTFPDRIPDNVLGQTVFWANDTATTHTTQNRVSTPRGLIYDATNSRLFIADSANNRILIQNVATITNGQNAANVLGQPNFTSSTAATTQNGMSAPYALAYDSTNSRLFIADPSNNRVLVQNVATITNGQNAANVLGQPDFTISTAGITQATMNTPYDLAYDQTNSRLFIADYNNRRVIVQNVASITNGQNAASVLGQPNFTILTATTTQNGMSTPRGLAYDATNSRLFIAEENNNRVTVQNVATITNGQNAANVLGQPDFTTPNNKTTQNGMNAPSNVAYDPTSRQLFVADYGNSRVTVFRAAMSQETLVSGTAYSDDGITPLGAGIQVSFLVNGVANGSTTTGAGGGFSFAAYPTVPGNVLTVYLDTNGGAQGVTVTEVSTGNLTDLNIYQNRLITRCDNSCTLTNTDLSTANLAGDSDISAIYTVDSGNLTLPGGKKLVVGSTGIFSPGGNVAVGSGVTINGTLTMAMNTLSLSGSWLKTSTANFNPGTSTVLLSGGNQTLSGSTTFYSLTKTVNAATTLTFAATTTQTVGGALTLQGSASNMLYLRSSMTGVQWKMDPQAIRVLNYLNVKDANNTNATPIYLSPTTTSNTGNNTNWVFYASAGILTNGAAAFDLLGQYGDSVFYPVPVYTKGTAHNTPPSKMGLSESYGLTLDTVGHRLFVVEKTNNRVLVYGLNSDNTFPDRIPDNVLGQPGFTSATAATTQATMNAPWGAGYDSANSRLFIGDFTNNRVLVYSVATITNEQNAANVLGQPNFTIATGTTTQNGMKNPAAFAYDSANSRLFVADNGNYRVTVYAIATITNGQNAANVLGQPNFTSALIAVAGNLMVNPIALAYDAVASRLFIAESPVHRVTVQNVATITNGQYAANVLGQPNFTSSLSVTTQNGMKQPGGLFYDSTNSRLFISESPNFRVTVQNVATITNGQNAANVLGQPDFTTATSAITQNGISSPGGLTYDTTNSRLFLADAGSNRVSIFQVDTITAGQNAIDEVGQTDGALPTPNPVFTKNTANGLPTGLGLRSSSGITLDVSGHRLFIADSRNNRILVYGLNSDNTFPDRIPDNVLGQPHFGLSTAATSQNGMSGVMDMVYDPVTSRLFLAEATNNRILVHSVTSITNGQNAANVLGQADYTTSTAGTTQATMNAPYGLGYDSTNSRLFVSETGNRRVTTFLVDTITDGQNAVNVLGQPNFTILTGTTTQNGMNTPRGLVYDAANSRLFVADTANNRVLVHSVASITNGQNAANVLGQPNFTIATATTTQNGLRVPSGVSYDPVNMRLFVTDSANNRILAYGVSSIANGQNATGVLGRPDFTTATSGTTQSNLLSPSDLVYDTTSRRLFVADAGNNRALLFDAGYSASAQISGIAYSDDGVTELGAGVTVSLLVNGVFNTSTTTFGGGAYTLTGFPVNPADVLTIYLDTGGGANGVTVTKATGSSISGVDIYQNRLIARCDNSCTLTNADLATANTVGDTDVSAVYSVSGGALTLPAGKKLVVWTGGTFAPGGNVAVGSGVTINGIFSPASSTVSLSGSWLKTSGGTFTAGTSTIRLNGVNQTLSGSSTFYNLKKLTGVTDTLTFAATTTQTIQNLLTLQGAASNLLSLRSSVSGVQWKIDPQGSRIVTYLNVQDSNNINAATIGLSYTSTNAGNNTNWGFITAPVTIQGTVYADDGTTPLTDKTVSLLLDGADKVSVTSTSTGSFTFTNVPTSTTDFLTIYLDTDGAEHGVVIAKAAAAGLTGVGLYQNQLILRCETSCAVTNIDLDIANAISDPDISAVYTIDSSNLQLPLGTKLTVGTNVLFTPNRNLVLGSNLTINGTLTMGANNISLSGSWLKASGGTFNPGTSTVNFDGVNQSLSGSNTFYNLTKNTSIVATLTLGATTTQTIGGTLTFQGGTNGFLVLRSSKTGVQWKIDPQNVRTISYVNVKDVNNVNATTIYLSPTVAADMGNNTNWVIYPPAGILVNGANAFDLLGQTGDSVVYPVPVYTNGTAQNTPPKRLGVSAPRGVAVDGTNHRLFVADGSNYRVLVYNLNSDNTLSDHLPDNVLGQGQFNTSTSALTQNGMTSLYDLVYDGTNSRLFVAEYTSNRILVYNVATITNGQNAANVLGQPNFTISTANTTQNGLTGPYGLTYDATNSRLFIADYSNSRVIVHNVATISNGQNAANVLGRPDFTTTGGATFQNGLSGPYGLAYDSTNSRLFIGEYSNNRVIVQNVATITNGQNAANVLGRPDFTTLTAATTQNGLNGPYGLTYDATNSRLFIADFTNYRVIVHNVASITNGQNAANVLGQPNFTSASPGTTQNGMSSPRALTYEGTNSRLFVVDTNYNRVIVHNVASITNGQNAASVLGQTDGSLPAPSPVYTKSTANDVPNGLGMSAPAGVVIDSAGHRLFVAEYTNNRVLVYGLYTDNTLPDRIPDNVLGQPHFGLGTAATTQNGVSGPYGLAYDPANSRLFVSNFTINRVTVYGVADITNGQNAANVLGQPNFTASAAATTQNGLSGPYGLGYDPTSSRLFVADNTNNRIIVYGTATITNGQNAVDAVGQTNGGSTTAPPVFTKSSANNAPNGLGMSRPYGVLFDGTGHRLFVSDAVSNNRILVYGLNTDNTFPDRIPDNVLGQSVFYSSAASTTQNGLSYPYGLAYDATNSRLFIADSSNNRILVQNVAAITNGQNAANVLGQPNFTIATGAVTQNGMGNPIGLSYDAAKSRLFVALGNSNRVLVYSVSTITNGQNAANVLGQPNFTGFAAGVTQATINAPYGLSYETTNSRLFIGDFSNNRVIVHNVATITNGQNAANVLGQTSFTASAAATTQNGMNNPTSLTYDSVNSRLFVGDIGNNRITVYSVATITNGQNATNVLGQPNFSRATSAVTQNGMSSPYGSGGYDATNSRLFVADFFNNRIIVYNVTTIADGQNALDVLGQTDGAFPSPGPVFTKGTADDALNSLGLSGPRDVTVDTTGHRLFVSDTTNNRVLVYPLNTDGTFVSRMPMNVLGQSIFWANGASTTQNGLSSPYGLDYDATNARLFVSDFTNNRILAYGVSSIANGQNATGVLGRPNFTTATAGTTQTNLSAPYDIAYDTTSRRLFVADYTNNRVPLFDAGYNPAAQITGTAYSDDGVTPLSAGVTVTLLVNGVFNVSTTTVGGGGFTLPGYPVNPADILTVYLNTDGGARGVTVTKATGSNISGVDIYQNRLIARCDNSCTLTNANLATANTVGDTDITAIYSVNSGVLSLPSTTKLIVWNGGTFAPGGDIAVGSGVTVMGTFAPESSTVSLSGSWLMVPGGSLTPGTSTVRFNGMNQTLSGSTMFYNLKKETSVADTLTLAATMTQTVQGTMTLRGTAGNILSLRSSLGGTQWKVDPQASRVVNYLNVQDSNNINATVISVSANNTNAGNNTNWGFSAAPINVRGTVYSDEGMTPLTGKTLSLLIDGMDKMTTTSTSTGAFTFTNVQSSAADMITLYLDTDGGEKGVTLTKSAVGGLTGADVYQNRLIVRCDGGCTLRNGDLNTANLLGDSDIAGVYTTSGEHLLLPSTTKLIVWAGAVYAPGGNVAAGGDITINGTLSAGSNVISLSGSWLKASGGTFTAGTSTVIFSGVNQTLSGSQTFYNLTKSTSVVATLTFAATVTQTVQNTLTLQGAGGNSLILRSSKTGVQWKIDPQNVRNVIYLNVQDANNVNATTIYLSPTVAADMGNNTNWVIYPPAGILVNGENAFDLLGQTGDNIFYPVPVYTKGTANNKPPNRWGMNAAYGICLDSTNHRLFVSDKSNNRILVYGLDSNNALTHRYADNVLGQPNFTISTGTTTQNGLSGPHGLGYDSMNSRLFIADRTNNRIIVHNVTTITDGQNAANVLGQSSFTTSTADTTQATMNGLYTLEYDSANSRLFIADYSNNRIIVHNVTTITDGQNAANVLGQTTFATSTSAATQNGMYYPMSLAYDMANSRLFIADNVNNRILVQNVASITNGQNAANVLGQANFIASVAATTQNGMNGPYGAVYDAINSRLFIAEYTNSRIIIQNVASITNGQNAANVLGRPDFTSAGSAATQSNLWLIGSLAYDSINSQLFVADSGNHRILVQNVASITNGQNAANVLGQTDGALPNPSPVYTKNTANDLPNNLGLSAPTEVAIDSAGHRLFVAEYTNNRVLVYRLYTDNTLPDRIPDNVLGQPHFGLGTAATTQNGMSGPYGLAYDPTNSRLFVSNFTINRVTVYGVAGIINGQNAANVLGQPNFTASAAAITQNGLSGPYGLGYDPTSSRLFVADNTNNRIIIYGTATVSNGQNAVDAVGQTDGESATNPGPLFTRSTANNVPNRLGMSAPYGIALDSVSHRLFISEYSNNRILVYGLNADNTFADRIPDNVLGQSVYYTITAATTQNGLSAPTSLTYDAANSRLFVAEFTNNRVTAFSVPTITNGQNAANVLGQPNFTIATATTTQNGMNVPIGLAYSSANSRLFVAQSTGNRVTMYNVSSITNGQNAVNVLGQPNFTILTGTTTQNGMNAPRDLDYDAANSRLFIVEYNNNRVIVQNVATITNGQNAANVLGQPNFARATAGSTQNGLNGPRGIAYDATNSRLFVANSTANRVTVYAVATITNGQNAANVLGRPDFTTTTAATTQNGLSAPYGIVYDGTNSRLFVADYTNNRVIVQNVASITNGQNAWDVVGQTDGAFPAPGPVFTKGTANDVLNSLGLSAPRDVEVDTVGHRLFVTDATNNRVLVYPLNTDGTFVSRIPMNVLGQPNFYTNTAATTQNGVSGPYNMTYDSTNSRLFVSNYTINRVTVYAATAITNGQNATGVLGQPNFTIGTAANTQNGMSGPTGLAYDSSSRRLFVADYTYNRVSLFDAGYYAGAQITGTAFSDDGVTPLAPGITVSLMINGVFNTSTTTVGGGGFTLSGYPVNQNDIITVYLDAGGPAKGVTVTKATGSNMAGVDVYQNRLIARCDNACTLTNSDLTTANLAADADVSAIYTVDGGALTLPTGKKLVVWSSGTFAPGGTVAVGSGVTVMGTFSPATYTVSLSGSWLTSPGGSLTYGTSTIRLNGTNQTISGSTTFFNLTKSTASTDTLTFGATTTQTVLGALMLKGAASNILSLQSSQSGTQWKIDPQGGRVVNYLNVKDSNNINATAISVNTTSSDAGNNLNWTFVTAPVTIQGIVYNDEGITPLAGKTVSLLIDGGDKVSVTSGAGGEFTFNNVQTSSADVITLYLDTNGSENGVTVTKSPLTGMADAAIYQNRLIVRCDSCTMRNADLNTANLSGDSDISSIFTVVDGNLITSPIGKLIIWSGTTFVPVGSIAAGSGITINGTLSLTGNNISLSGSWLKASAATFTPGTSTVTFNGFNQSLSGSNTFSNLTKTVTSTGTLTLAATTTQTVGGTLVLQGGIGQRLSLRSSQTGTQWKIDPQSSRTINYVDAKDAHNINAAVMFLSPTVTVNSGNNTNWIFYPAAATLTDGENAFDAIGQSTVDDVFYPIPAYTRGTANNTPPGRMGMSGPNGLALDAFGHRLFLSDYSNNRILVYGLNSDNTIIDRIPDNVLGQPDFTNATAATTQNGVSGASGLAYDATNSRLFAADYSNSRVIIHNVSTITNGQNAVSVLGQPTFVDSTVAVTQNGMRLTTAVAYDSANSRLFVSQSNANRVTVYNVSTITNGQNAVNVLGQPNFTRSTANTTQSGMSGPNNLSYDSVNSRLFVGEFTNNRVTVYNVATITNGQNAANVLGQPTFGNTGAATTQNGVNIPSGLAYDSANSRLFVGQSTGNRVTVYDVTTITNGQNAANVLGQPDFTIATAATTQNGMNAPTALVYNPSSSQLFVAQSTGNRITVYNVVTITNGQNAVDALGQSDGSLPNANPIYTKSTANDVPNGLGMSSPYGLALDTVGHRLFVADGGNNRVLVYGLYADNTFTDRIPDNVLGQPHFGIGTAATTQNGMSGPYGLAYDAINSRLFVSHYTLHRVMVYTTATITNGQNAVNVLGQPNFTASATASTQNGLSSPYGLAYDLTNSRLFVADAGNHRIVVYSTSSIANGQNAVDVLGQTDGTVSSPSPIFTKVSAHNVPHALGMNGPYAIAIDAGNHRLFVGDISNNRILVYGLNSDNTFTDRLPDNLLGQSYFYTNSAATTQNGLSSPYGLAYDQINSRLFVSDGGNNRVITFAIASITNGQNAANVLGQPNFTTATAATTQNGMNTPFGLAYDQINSRLFVANANIHRVTVYTVSAITDGQNAANVLGQTTFTASATATTQNGMYGPSGIAYAPANSRLFVTDYSNNRVLVHSVATITNGQNALNVLGRPDFTTSTSATSQNGMSGPRSVTYDATNSRLFVGEYSNNRVIIQNVSSITNGQNAAYVLGQPNFTASASAATQNGLSAPYGITYDETNSQLLIADYSNNRVIQQNVATIIDGQNAADVLGQTDGILPNPGPVFTKGAANDAPNSLGFNSPRGVAVDPVGHRLFVADYTNNRVLVFPLNTDGTFVNRIATNVLGQPHFGFNTAATTQNGISTPMDLVFDSTYNRLFIGENTSKRVLIQNIASITNGQNAAYVLGQPDFTASATATTQNGVSSLRGMAYDMANKRLFLSDSGNNRVLQFDAAAPLIATTTTLTSSLNPADVGAEITFTATVSSSAVTGTLTFKDGASTIGSATVGHGSGKLLTSSLTLGLHNMTAVYSGDDVYSGSTSATLVQAVGVPLPASTKRNFFYFFGL